MQNWLFILNRKKTIKSTPANHLHCFHRGPGSSSHPHPISLCVAHLWWQWGEFGPSHNPEPQQDFAGFCSRVPQQAKPESTYTGTIKFFYHTSNQEHLNKAAMKSTTKHYIISVLDTMVLELGLSKFNCVFFLYWFIITTEPNMITEIILALV